jgi:hypothetical protein
MQAALGPADRVIHSEEEIPMTRIEWQKIKLDDGDYESAGVFDLNNDGRMEIVCGAHWYELPEFKRHRLCDVPPNGDYYDDFSTIPLDVNGNGWLDIITGGWGGGQLIWRENPGDTGQDWITHVIDACGPIETTRAWDVDGDGKLEICPNTPCSPLVFYKLERDRDGRATGKFRKVQVSPDGDSSGHGLGFGDLGGGLRGFIVHNGIWQAPADALNGRWEFLPEFELGSASVPILVADVNEDGASEIVVGQAHGFGLDYYTMQRNSDGTRVWTKHPIDPYFSQYHDLVWADVDGDGKPELVTGNRYRAHLGRDEGETEVVGLYVFKYNGESFTKEVVDHGLVPHASGTGIHLAVADVTGDGRLDIVAPGKDGLYLFRNLGPITSKR